MKTLSIWLVAAALLPSGALMAQPSYYEPSGVQQNVPVATVTSGGWTECYSDVYADSGQSLDELLTGCVGENLMLACRPVDSDTLTLAAWARREDVTFDTGGEENGVEHEANAVNWYFSSNVSWGFLPAGLEANKNSCDYSDSDNVPPSSLIEPGLRMCWHTGGGSLDDGYRCGDDRDEFSPGSLNGDAGWERLVYVNTGATPVAAPVTADEAVPGLGFWGMLLMLFSLVMTAGWVLRRR